MRKILISSLGSGKLKKYGDYSEANYKIEDKIYYNRKYISSALSEHFKIDKIYYIGTLGSMWENIYKDLSNENNKFDEECFNNLYLHIGEFLEMDTKSKKEVQLSSLNLSKITEVSNGKVVPILTKYGLNDSEIFENFSYIIKIIDELENGDKIYLDITHSFRSNAFWMFLVMNYINDVIDKDIEIEYISYGMFEAKESDEKELEITPVINLNLFFTLTKWIKGAYAFKNYGNSSLIRSLVNDKDINNKISNFSDAISINYVSSIKESIESLKRNFDKINSIDGPAKLIIPNIVTEFLNHFEGAKEDYEILIRLAEWHAKQERYAMVFTNIQEAMKSFIATGINLDKNISFRDADDEIKIALDKFHSFCTKRNKNKLTPLGKELASFYDVYKSCRRIRNNIAHSGDNAANPISSINSINKYIETCNRIFKKKNFINDCIINLDIEI